ncbi:peptide chain release factor N(5)-glutamine methyltransferase [Anaerobium acetethylicum]|uniref:Release factor glutamine methyltransferase n=1 Tax=Anaerobium acetethylicum TaxID=1619234 RepID=A0A1D3TR03_9FIRM|nr:peptide chain release factor N(5)-glutamine methyltransferase [Anaerobium acetethylicum]SCP96073.1 release factor glutamine methyltransferase [Anaerobium acetethylicum]
MTIEETLKYGREQLNKAAVENGDLDAWLLLAHVLKIDRNYYFLHGKDSMGDGEFGEYERLIAERSKRIPLQYLTGEQEFMGLLFKVNPEVLIPRQDTEILVEEALKRLEHGMSVLDMCTGSGCILISLLHYRKGIRGTGSDISKGAIRTAEENARNCGVDVEFCLSDLFDHVSGKFDMIVSNPPYIRSDVIPTLMEEVRSHEPMSALDGFEDGLYFYRRIIDEGREYLNPGGWIYFEIGHDQGRDVMELFENMGYRDIQTVKDLAGLDRVVYGRYMEAES